MTSNGYNVAANIGFLLDTTLEVKSQVALLKHFTSYFYVSPTHTQFALLEYSTEPIVRFKFNDATNLEHLSVLIKNNEFIKASRQARLDVALDFAYKSLFTSTYGARTSVPR